MKKKEKYPLIVFSVIVLFFYLFFTHLIIKTDDGHFLGILNEDSFNIFEWLKERYLTLSGRTVSEFMMMSFLKLNTVFWKLLAAGAFTYMIWFAEKMCSAFSGVLTQLQKNIFCCCVPFLVFIGSLNPGAFWFAGSFTFLFPFTAFLMTVTPLVFEFFEVKHNRIAMNVISVIASFLACSQEQTAALTVTFLVVLIVALLLKHKLKIYHIISLITSVSGTFWLFTSPGMTGRIAMEGGSFSRFSEMNVFEKLLCGITNYFGYSFFMSVIVTGIFAVLLFLTVSAMYDKKKVKIFAKVFLAFLAMVCAGVNAAYVIVCHKVPDKGFEEIFRKGDYGAFDIAVIILCFMLLMMFAAMLVLIIIKNRKLGITVSLLAVAAVMSAVVLGFSSSVYASGQRVFFFADVLTLFASGVLISGGKSKKNIYVYNTAVIIAVIMLIVNCFNFALLEIPIMG